MGLLLGKVLFFLFKSGRSAHFDFPVSQSVASSPYVAERAVSAFRFDRMAPFSGEVEGILNKTEKEC